MKNYNISFQEEETKIKNKDVFLYAHIFYIEFKLISQYDL